ncbi:MAG TPA: hypothetical protein VKZ57_00825 [Sphingobacterium sp.]|uniref:hypothetical protein n=1 Tax=Sphingobacterium sp. FBM7-1 TaxID=2886688 RepID=UPI001D11A709|nr:hypothetical protein [Sphingobacterium sp. FBM7-1]MCC2600328.1 hypothetical protein [Sphingobacterium sp. FBM7-1]HLT86097.1 hypothetical protein [Sphingobacterium sp.]
MKKLFILLLISCSIQVMAQETQRNDKNQNNEDHYNNPEYAPMGRLYAAHFDAYLYVLTPERRKDFLNWYYQGNKNLVERREQLFEDRLREVEAMTQAQRDSIMKIPPTEERKSITNVKLMNMEEQIFSEHMFVAPKEIVHLFRGYPVYVVSTKGKLPNSEVETSSIAIYFQKTMNWLYSSVIMTTH